MKILYAVHNNLDSEIQLKYFLQNCKYDVVTIGESKSKVVNFDLLINNKISQRSKEWRQTKINLCKTLNINSVPGFPKYTWDEYERIKQYIKDVNPDLIIVDNAKLVAKVVALYFPNIQIWNAGPSNIIEGIKLPFDFWQELSYDKISHYQEFYYMDKPNRMFICSPFGHLTFPLEIRENFEWVTPYFAAPTIPSKFYDFAGVISDKSRHDVLNKIVTSILFDPKFITDIEDCSEILSAKHFLSEGDVFTLTSYLFSCKNPNIILTPSLSNLEHRTNSGICHLYKLGFNLNLLESLSYDAPDILTDKLQNPNEPYIFFDFEKYPIKHLHTIIEDKHENKS